MDRIQTTLHAAAALTSRADKKGETDGAHGKSD
jgi:hypothetical protein